MRFGVSAVVRAALACALLALPTSARSQTNNECDEPGEAPDLLAGPISTPTRWGSVNGITAYSFASNACNLGTCWAKFIGATTEHPVIAQNMFRLKNGRFEQIGQSWLKHAFAASQLGVCSAGCLPSSTSSRLGVNCSDPYTSSLNGTQSSLGPKFEVNGYTGEFPYPPFHYSQTGDAIFKRLQVHNNDLDPAQNVGASYFVEVQYVARDDAAAGNGANNASYRQASISGGSGTYNVGLTGAQMRGDPAIKAWKAADPSVVEAEVMAPDDGKIFVSGAATDLGDGYWHYEYAVQNLNSHRNAGTITVPLPAGASVRNIGFHDVDYHSGELIDGEDWPALVETAPPAVRWSTQTFIANSAANAVRWGTLYNFRFDADVPPADGELTLGLWRPGTPSSLPVAMVAPRVCDHDGTCDPGETCLRCPSDCGEPDGSGQCCGNGVCQPSGEGPCVCAADCGAPTPAEAACGNAQDDDCDGAVDCADTDCCADGACLAGSDADADGHAAACDCDDGDGQVWATPGEVPNLSLWREGTGEAMLGWDSPADPGGATLGYETLRSSNPSDFGVAAICVPDPNPGLTNNSDPEDPPAGDAFFYLVRARNGCPAGGGSLGADSSGQLRTGRACP